MESTLTEARERILSLVESHTKWRAECLNLVAAENAMSPLVREALSSDLAQRYGDYTGRNLSARRYFGTRYIAELETLVNSVAADLFRAEYVELRPVSGHVAGGSLIMALCRSGDLVIELSRTDGGHRVASKLAQSPLVDFQVEYFPFDAARFNIDVDRTLELVRARRPRLVLVGSSNFLFPAPLRALAEGLVEFPETVLAYDASHVLGLIAGGEFQDPLGEGAQIVVAGTQKSFPGPQGGLIYANSEDMINAVSDVVHPAILSNHHLARIPALGLAMLEMKQWGAQYASEIIRNAQALARALDEHGLGVVGREQGYTRSHTVLLSTAGLGDNEALGRKLEDANIIVTACRLPESLGGAGLRLGTNEITRYGVVEEDMPEIARLVADCLLARRPIEAVRAQVREMASHLDTVHYTWPTP